MTSQPDTTTEPTEQEEALYEAVATTLENITGFWREAETAAMLEALAEPIAAILRHAAADALNEQARRITQVASFYERQARSLTAKGQQPSSDLYALRARQAHGDAGLLRNAAADKLAEGYEFECAATFPPATWSSPGYGCETKVPNEGDYCPACEPEDDEDPRWSE